MVEVLPPSVKGIGLSKLNKRKAQTLLDAARHNLRDSEGRGWMHKSDPAKIRQNRNLAGPSESAGVVALQAELMARAGYVPARHDYTQAFEVVFTTPTEFPVSYEKYFAWCLAWTTNNLGKDIVLNASSHFDESEPHLHILMAPVVNGDWVGSNFASTKTWPKLQAKFGLDVEAALGLKLAPQLKGRALTKAANEVKERLTELLEPHVTPDVLGALLRLAGRKPAGLLGPLGITAGYANDGGEEFKRIALSTGRGPGRERAVNPYGIEPNPYGIENRVKVDPEKADPILVYGIESATQPAALIFDGVQDSQEIVIDGGLVSAESTPASTQPLSDIPDEHGEVAPPTKSTSCTLAGTTTQRLHSLQPDFVVNEPLEYVTDHESALTRERDCDQEAGRWSEELGEFITASPNASKAPPRAARQAAERWVASALGNVSRPGMARRMAEPDFEQRDRVEVEAWQD